MRGGFGSIYTVRRPPRSDLSPPTVIKNGFYFGVSYAPSQPRTLMCCIMIDRNHCHPFACSTMLQLGSRAPIAIRWPAVVLVIWPHFNGNAQRHPHSASLGLALFSSRICWFLCKRHGYPRGKSNRPKGHRKIFAQIWYFLVGCHWRFFGVLACLPIDQKNANDHRPKSTESGPRVLGSPSADLIFLLDARGLCIETNRSVKKTALIPNWRCAGAAAHFH